MGQDQPDEPMVCLDMFPRLPPGARPRAAFLKTKLWGDAQRRAHPKPGQPPIPLRVAFLDGSRALQRKVEAAACEWMDYAHVQFAFGHAPEDAEVRISFAASPGGCWSLLGTDCLTRPSDQPTMNLGKVDARLAPEMLRRYVLHELGHALGLIHEHSQPGATIPWNEKKVYEHYLGLGWTRKMVKSNVLERYKRSDATGTRFDRKSIMLYPVPAQFTDGKFVAGWNTDLSPTDKKLIGQAYPRPPSR